jgi:predicted nucleic acid-binding protein
LAAQIRAAGRQHRYRVQDLWLASQALQHSCRLLTRNHHDFEDIPGLDLVLYQLARRRH